MNRRPFVPTPPPGASSAAVDEVLDGDGGWRRRAVDRFWRAGATGDDLNRFVAALLRPPVSRDAQNAVSLLALLTHDHADVSVPDMLAWAIVAHGDPAVLFPAGLRRWEDAGVGHGWLYQAAGLTPGEVTAGRGPSEADATMMAALRGFDLPAPVEPGMTGFPWDETVPTLTGLSDHF